MRGKGHLSASSSLLRTSEIANSIGCSLSKAMISAYPLADGFMRLRTGMIRVVATAKTRCRSEESVEERLAGQPMYTRGVDGTSSRPRHPAIDLEGCRSLGESRE